MMPPAAFCRQLTGPTPQAHHGEVTKDRGSWGADLTRPSVKGAWFLSRDCPLFRPDISPVGANFASVMQCRWSLLPAVGRCCCCQCCCQPTSAPPTLARVHPCPAALPHRTDCCRPIRRRE